MSKGRYTKAIVFSNDRYHSDELRHGEPSPFPTARVSCEKVIYARDEGRKLKPGQSHYRVVKLGSMLVPNGLTWNALHSIVRRRFPDATDYRYLDRFGDFCYGGNSW